MQSDPNVKALRELNAKCNFAPCDNDEPSSSNSRGKVIALQFTDAGLGTTGAQALASAMAPYNDVLQTLMFSGNAIRPLGMSMLLDAFASLRALTRLSIINEQLGDEGVVHLARVLPHMPVLAQLTISRNGIKMEGASALAKALPSCVRLERFVAHANPFRDFGIALLAKGLGELPGLVTVGLSGTGMGDEGLVSLLTALTKQDGLTTADKPPEEGGQASEDTAARAATSSMSLLTQTEGSSGKAEGSSLAETPPSVQRCKLEVSSCS